MNGDWSFISRSSLRVVPARPFVISGDVTADGFRSVEQLDGYARLRPDWAVFGFAAFGLATEFVPLGGEALDTLITTILVFLKRILPGPFRKIIIRVGKEAIRIFRESGLQAAVEYAEKTVRFLAAVLAKGDRAIGRMARVIDSDALLEAAGKLHKKLGDNLVDELVDIADDANLGDDLVRKTIEALGGLPDNVLEQLTVEGTLRSSLQGFARTVKNGVDPKKLNKLLQNDFFFRNYPRGKFLGHLEKILTENPNVIGLSNFFKDSQNDLTIGVSGRALEIFAAATKSGSTNRVVNLGAKAMDTKGIDVVFDTEIWQVKGSKNALLDEEKTADGVAANLITIIEKAEANSSIRKPLKLVLPQNHNIEKDFLQKLLNNPLLKAKNFEIIQDIPFTWPN